MNGYNMGLGLYKVKVYRNLHKNYEKQESRHTETATPTVSFGMMITTKFKGAMFGGITVSV